MIDSKMISGNNISLTYSKKTIFENFSFNIGKGENVSFSAPSGKGKTTLLKMLMGYVIPDQGEIRINDRLLNEGTIKQARDSITWVPQNINLPVENGHQLLKLMQAISNQTAVEDYMEKLGLNQTYLGEDFTRISIGEKQRIIIAICLSFEKEIILLDEPTSSLDDKSVERLINTVSKLEGKTVVTASHNKKWTDSCDKVITL